MQLGKKNMIKCSISKQFHFTCYMTLPKEYMAYKTISKVFGLISYHHMQGLGGYTFMQLYMLCNPCT